MSHIRTLAKTFTFRKGEDCDQVPRVGGWCMHMVGKPRRCLEYLGPVVGCEGFPLEALLQAMAAVGDSAVRRQACTKGGRRSPQGATLNTSSIIMTSMSNLS